MFKNYPIVRPGGSIQSSGLNDLFEGMEQTFNIQAASPLNVDGNISGFLFFLDTDVRTFTFLNSDYYTGTNDPPPKLARFTNTSPLPSYTRTDNTITMSASGLIPSVTCDGVIPANGDRFLHQVVVGRAHVDNGIWTFRVATPTIMLAIAIAGDSTAINQVQSYYFTADAGTYTLTFDDGGGPQTTGAINWNDDATAVEAALVALSNITSCTVTGSGSSADPFLVTFLDSFTNYTLMTADISGLTDTVILDRSPDADVSEYLPAGSMCMITEGVLYSDSLWSLVTDNPITLNTTALQWATVNDTAFARVTLRSGYRYSFQEVGQDAFGNWVDVVGGISGILNLSEINNFILPIGIRVIIHRSRISPSLLWTCSLPVQTSDSITYNEITNTFLTDPPGSVVTITNVLNQLITTVSSLLDCCGASVSSLGFTGTAFFGGSLGDGTGSPSNAYETMRGGMIFEGTLGTGTGDTGLGFDNNPCGCNGIALTTIGTYTPGISGLVVPNVTLTSTDMLLVAVMFTGGIDSPYNNSVFWNDIELQRSGTYVDALSSSPIGWLGVFSISGQSGTADLEVRGPDAVAVALYSLSAPAASVLITPRGLQPFFAPSDGTYLAGEINTSSVCNFVFEAAVISVPDATVTWGQATALDTVSVPSQLTLVTAQAFPEPSVFDDTATFSTAISTTVHGAGMIYGISFNCTGPGDQSGPPDTGGFIFSGSLQASGSSGGGSAPSGLCGDCYETYPVDIHFTPSGMPCPALNGATVLTLDSDLNPCIYFSDDINVGDCTPYVSVSLVKWLMYIVPDGMGGWYLDLRLVDSANENSVFQYWYSDVFPQADCGVFLITLTNFFGDPNFPLHLTLDS